MCNEISGAVTVNSSLLTINVLVNNKSLTNTVLVNNNLTSTVPFSLCELGACHWERSHSVHTRDPGPSSSG